MAFCVIYSIYLVMRRADEKIIKNCLFLQFAEFVMLKVVNVREVVSVFDPGRLRENTRL